MTIHQEKTLTEQCWSCGDMRAAHFCTSCGKVQPAAPADYFGFFGLPRKLHIDLKQLEREFYALSRKLHPDLAARASAEEQVWALEKSSQLNDAYRTLKDPVARTQYLLELEGYKLEEGPGKKQAPPELLEEVFDLNMQLQELKMNRQMGEDDPELQRQLGTAKRNFEQKLETSDAELRALWTRWDAAVENGTPGTERRAILDSMVALLGRRSYIRNLVRDVNEALEA